MVTLASRIPNVNDLLEMPTEYLAKQILRLARQNSKNGVVDPDSFLFEWKGTGQAREGAFVYEGHQVKVSQAFNAAMHWLRKELLIVDAGEEHGQVLITYRGNEFLDGTP